MMECGKQFSLQPNRHMTTVCGTLPTTNGMPHRQSCPAHLLPHLRLLELTQRVKRQQIITTLNEILQAYTLRADNG